MSSESFDSDEFYFSDGDEDVPVSAVDQKFLQAKGGIETNAKDSIKALTEILKEDEAQQGRWTYKALKNLAKASRKLNAYDDMLRYFKQCFHGTYAEISKPKMEKAMNKFINTSEGVPSEHVMQLLDIILERAKEDMSAFADLWSGTMLRKATLLFHVQRYKEALDQCEKGIQFCRSCTRAVRTNDTHLFHFLMTMMQVGDATEDYFLLRKSYFELTHIPLHLVHAPPIGTVALLAGQMYLRAQDWRAAHATFVLAFQHMNECGDGQRIACLKYATVASMLTGSPADGFSGGEEKPYAEHKELVPVVKLLRAFIHADVHAFQAVLADPQHAECLHQDRIVAAHVDLLLYRLRLNVLLKCVECFVRVSLKELAERLTLSVENTKLLCGYAIRHGLIPARLDDVTNILNVYSTERTTEFQRMSTLADWSTDLNNAVRSQQVTWSTDAREGTPA
ncbi:COP9 signalosome complex subunit 2 [Strigomonas culicis]|uniref:COP9 signalosome complex subunit 2 n=1 Tax=Strigomonas culicis TaxID=28005 RepID=S9VXS6_9TRYP|nr:COP9 signalosome complex subunit 2 [Strigomonas culicis]EPY31861.1 COP9 signalosome complex subunit 2 [Strigomonas culicis]|eukprot:EPY24287.1 COP9 signalosome complex subunit 2 [Strigomonas culicis]